MKETIYFVVLSFALILQLTHFFDQLPFKTCAALAGRIRAGGGNTHRAGTVGLGCQITMIREGHEHGVATHQVRPLKGFRITGLGVAEILEDHIIINDGGYLAISGLECYTAQTKIDDLEPGVDRGIISNRDINQG